jgi:hypothetical protein
MHAAPHVIVVGVDRLSARGPNITALMSSGAWTLHARAVPAISAPNWASMITGTGPPDRHAIEPSCKGPSGIFPTMFLVLRQQKPSADIAIFHQWEGFARLVEPGIPSIIESAKDPLRRAIDYLGAHSPDLLFVQLDGGVDLDQLIGKLVSKLRADTVLLLTAAHGVNGGAMDELEIPWIISGPGVRAGTEVKAPVNQFDTAATVAYLLGLQPPPCWIGRTVSEALRPRAAVRGLPEPGKRPPPSTIRMK